MARHAVSSPCGAASSRSSAPTSKSSRSLRRRCRWPPPRELSRRAAFASKTLSELRAREGDESLNRIHELYTASRVDQPTLGSVTARPFEDWRREVFDELHGLPDAYFVASDGGRLVGCSAVHATGEDVLRILITGVLPEYRRQGIARLLKLRVHAWARANGYREIHTSTANAAVVALNSAPGYAIVASWGGYELAIR
jgi:GNAT superfamily N-acetyltransferase